MNVFGQTFSFLWCSQTRTVPDWFTSPPSWRSRCTGTEGKDRKQKEIRGVSSGGGRVSRPAPCWPSPTTKPVIQQLDSVFSLVLPHTAAQTGCLKTHHQLFCSHQGHSGNSYTGCRDPQCNSGTLNFAALFWCQKTKTSFKKLGLIFSWYLLHDGSSQCSWRNK